MTHKLWLCDKASFTAFSELKRIHPVYGLCRQFLYRSSGTETGTFPETFPENRSRSSCSHFVWNICLIIYYIFYVYLHLYLTNISVNVFSSHKKFRPKWIIPTDYPKIGIKIKSVKENIAALVKKHLGRNRFWYVFHWSLYFYVQSLFIKEKF